MFKIHTKIFLLITVKIMIITLILMKLKHFSIEILTIKLEMKVFNKKIQMCKPQ